jgi:DNA polymerase delta subunit 1
MVTDAKEKGNIRTHMNIAARLANAISDIFPSPIELEFEKCYEPFLLFSKKRYAGKMYVATEDPTVSSTFEISPGKLDIKGIQLVRRDCSPIVKTTTEEMLGAIMHDLDISKAVEVAKTTIMRLLTGQIPREQLIVSKTLRGSYKIDQPHAAVARKISQRRGWPVPLNERVPYIFIKPKDPLATLQVDRAEDPDYQHTQGLEIDVLFYYDHQLTKPIQSLLEIMDPVGRSHLEAVFKDPEICKIESRLREVEWLEVQEGKRLKYLKDNKLKEITSFFTKKERM